MLLDDDLNQAIALNKKGRIVEARKILNEIVQDSPNNEKAWMWLANTYSDNLERIKVLEKCLKNNPDSQAAQEWLTTFKLVEANKAHVFRQGYPDFQASHVDTWDDLLEGDERGSSESRNDPDQINFIQQLKKKPEYIILAVLALWIFGGVCFLSGWLSPRLGILSGSSISTPTLTVIPSPSHTHLPSLTASPSPSPSPSPTSTSTATPFVITATVNIDKVFLRSGPSTDYNIVLCQLGNCAYTKDTQVKILAKHEVFSEIWFFVMMPDDKTGWLYKGWLHFKGDLNAVPNATANPTNP